MSNYLEYKGFYGTVEYSSDDDVLYGKVIGLDHSLISYEGRSLIELKKDFHDAVDDYLDSNVNDYSNLLTDKTSDINLKLNEYLKNFFSNVFKVLEKLVR